MPNLYEHFAIVDCRWRCMIAASSTPTVTELIMAFWSLLNKVASNLLRCMIDHYVDHRYDLDPELNHGLNKAGEVKECSILVQ